MKRKLAKRGRLGGLKFIGQGDTMLTILGAISLKILT